MLDGIGSFFLVLGGESHEAHLKGSVDNRDHGYGPSESEDDIGRPLDNPRDITERNISFAEFFGCYAPTTEYPSIGIGENMVYEDRSNKREEGIEDIFHRNLCKNKYSPDCIDFSSLYKFFHSFLKKWSFPYNLLVILFCLFLLNENTSLLDIHVHGHLQNSY